MMKKILGIIGLLCVSMSLHAGPLYIDHDNENYWTSPELGLDFMDLTVTEGYTYDDIIVETSAGGLFDGWRLASGAESRFLYQLFAGGSNSFQGWAPVHYDNALTWFRLFGYSDAEFGNAWDVVSNEPTGYVNWVQIFNADKVAAHVAINTTQQYGKEGWFSTQNFGFTSWALDETYNNAPYAALMTRSATAVPEPEPLTVMLFGLSLLLARRCGLLGLGRRP